MIRSHHYCGFGFGYDVYFDYDCDFDFDQAKEPSHGQLSR